MDTQCGTNHLAGIAHISTREIVKVLSVDRHELRLCSLSEAKRLVKNLKAEWLDAGESIIASPNVNVLDHDKAELQPCTLLKACRLVSKKRARWLVENESLIMEPKYLWGWNEEVLKKEAWNENKITVRYRAENRDVEIPIKKRNTGTLVEQELDNGIRIKVENEILVRPIVCHRAGRNGRTGFYSCSYSEFAFLASTGAIELKGGTWWLAYCPGRYKFLRRSHGSA